MAEIVVSSRLDLSGLHRYEREAPRKVAAVLERYAELIAREAKALAPVDTGYLREHIDTDLSRLLPDLVALVVSGADYSRFLEFGTSRMAAQPFMRPAYERHAKALFNDLRAALS